MPEKQAKMQRLPKQRENKVDAATATLREISGCY